MENTNEVNAEFDGGEENKGCMWVVILILGLALISALPSIIDALKK